LSAKPSVKPTQQRKNEDADIVDRALYASEGAEYSDSINPHEPGALRFERVKRYHRTKADFDDIRAVYGLRQRE